MKSIYDVHPGVAMVQDWIAGLKKKTGKTLDDWVLFVKMNGPATEKFRRDWLKREHGFGTNAAWWLAERTDGKGLQDSDPEAYLKAAADYVTRMYAGGKAGLIPIHDEILKRARKLGKDVRVCPCKTIVPLYREHVFAQIKPSTRMRIDLGFALGDMKATGRLIDTGGFAKKDRITHRIEIASVAELDSYVNRWLKKAYDLDA